MSMPQNVIVIGAGPAGLSLASALASRGLEVALVSQRWPQPWPHNYGLWSDELSHDPQLAERISHSWDAPTVHMRGQRPRALPRTYVRLDNDAARALLTKRLLEAGGRAVAGRAIEVRHDSTSSAVVLDDGDVWRAAIVIDATGHEPRFARRLPDTNPGFQIAHGVTARLTASSRRVDGMRVMDWRPASRSRDCERAPSFLYAMQLDEETAFFEETSLVARPGASIHELRARLDARLEAEGFELAEVIGIERCVIPMGHNLPDFSTRTIAWGGAASMVQPASGYQIACVFRRAASLADGLARAIEDGARGAALSRRAWQLVWPAEELRRRRFFMYGMEAMLEMDLPALERFFSTFFELSPELWKGYLSGTASIPEITRAMFSMFGAADMSTRLGLVRPASTSVSHTMQLVRGLVGTDNLRAALGQRWRR